MREPGEQPGAAQVVRGQCRQQLRHPALQGVRGPERLLRGARRVDGRDRHEVVGRAVLGLRPQVMADLGSGTEVAVHMRKGAVCQLQMQDEPGPRRIVAGRRVQAQHHQRERGGGRGPSVPAPPRFPQQALRRFQQASGRRAGTVDQARGARRLRQPEARQHAVHGRPRVPHQPPPIPLADVAAG